jgi:hypothetical protein
MWNLVGKGFLRLERKPGGYEWYWLTDSGKEAMDRHPHAERITSAG